MSELKRPRAKAVEHHVMLTSMSLVSKNREIFRDEVQKWLQLAILYVFDPDDENEVAIVCAMLSRNRVTSPAAIIVLFLSH